MPAEIELDADDAWAIHFLATSAGRSVGTARVVMHRRTAKIGRMAVLKSYRHKGVGTKLLKRALARAKRLRARKIYLHAQTAVIGFYQKMNFRPVGPVFDEAGIPHRRMILENKINRRQKPSAAKPSPKEMKKIYRKKGTVSR
ncbi:MAG TPA: GNAT family N-acetyltransferase [Candidatus Binatia bacterium]